MTSLPHTHIRERDLAELIAGIPYVIGFPPTDSLVLYSFRQCPALALSTTIRVDLPSQENVPAVVEKVLSALTETEAVAATATVVGGEQEDHRGLVDELRKALSDKDILLTHASWVSTVAHGVQWQCYDDPLCGGTVPDPRTSALAAAIAVAGETTYPDRAAMAAQLAPDPEEALSRREELLDTYLRVPNRPYDGSELDADLETLESALDRAATARELPTLTDRELVRLARALSHAEVKDECLAAALTEDPKAAEILWTALVRALPAPERAEPAFLLAMSAYLRGAGILASMALKVALDSNPEHRTAILLDHALRGAVPPARIREMLIDSIIRNNCPDDTSPWEPATPEPAAPRHENDEGTAADAAPPHPFTAVRNVATAGHTATQQPATPPAPATPATPDPQPDDDAAPPPASAATHPVPGSTPPPASPAAQHTAEHNSAAMTPADAHASLTPDAVAAPLSPVGQQGVAPMAPSVEPAADAPVWRLTEQGTAPVAPSAGLATTTGSLFAEPATTPTGPLVQQAPVSAATAQPLEGSAPPPAAPAFGPASPGLALAPVAPGMPSPVGRQARTSHAAESAPAQPAPGPVSPVVALFSTSLSAAEPGERELPQPPGPITAFPTERSERV